MTPVIVLGCILSAMLAVYYVQTWRESGKDIKVFREKLRKDREMEMPNPIQCVVLIVAAMIAISDKSAHSFWDYAAFAVVVMVIYKSFGTPKKKEGKEEAKKQDAKSEDVTSAVNEEPDDDTWKFAPLPVPADGGRYSSAQLETMSIDQLNRVRFTTNTETPVELLVKAALAGVKQESEKGGTRREEDREMPSSVKEQSQSDENYEDYKEFLAERAEILRHKWIESEKAGHDIGFEKALLDWIVKHRDRWLAQRRMRADAGQTLKEPSPRQTERPPSSDLGSM